MPHWRPTRSRRLWDQVTCNEGSITRKSATQEGFHNVLRRDSRCVALGVRESLGSGRLLRTRCLEWHPEDPGLGPGNPRTGIIDVNYIHENKYVLTSFT